MNKFKKSMLLGSLAFGSFVFSSHSSAGGLDSMFESTLSSYSPGTSWEAAGRFGYVGPGGKIKFKSKTLQLVNVTPPSFSAGCGGISWNLGGIDFIDGEEIIEFLQAAGQAAASQAILIAMDTLCPPCAGWLGYLQDQARAASSSAIDSCELGKKLADNTVGQFSTKVKSNCSSTSSDSNADSSYFRSLSTGICGVGEGLSSMVKTFKDGLEGEDNREEAAAVADTIYANPFWNALKRAKIIDVSLVSSGTTYAAAEGNLSPEQLLTFSFAEAFNSLYVENKDDTSDISKMYIDNGGVSNNKKGGVIVSMMLCGSNFSPAIVSPGSTIDTYCKGAKKVAENMTVFTCGLSSNPSQVSSEFCTGDGVEESSPGSNVYGTAELLNSSGVAGEWFPKYGFKKGIFEIVESTMKKAFDNIDADKSPADNNPYFMFVLEYMPFDLYRVMNIASVNPQIAQSIVNPMGAYMSLEVVRGAFEKMYSSMTFAEQKPGGVGKVAVSKGVKASLGALKQTFEADMKTIMTGIKDALDFQTVIMDRVSSVEQKVATGVVARQLNEGRRFTSQSMNRP